MKNQIRKALAILFFLLPLYTFSQKTTSTTKEDVIQEVKSQLTVLSSTDGDLTKYCNANNITGEFVMDLTIQGKGKLLTIFMVSSSVEDVKYQNMLKNKLMGIQFSNVKLPKNERAKFRCTLTF